MTVKAISNCVEVVFSMRICLLFRGSYMGIYRKILICAICYFPHICVTYRMICQHLLFCISPQTDYNFAKDSNLHGVRSIYKQCTISPVDMRDSNSSELVLMRFRYSAQDPVQLGGMSRLPKHLFFCPNNTVAQG